MPRLTVKNHRPVQWSLAIIACSMLFALFTWLMLDKSHWSVIRDRISSSQESKSLRKMNQEIETENGRLREQVLMLEKTAQLDRQTAVLVQNDLKGLQDEIFKLKRELEFYQGIMNSTRDVQGLNIHDIHIEPLNRQQSYHLNLVLTHVTKSVNVVSCVMDVSIEGRVSGELSYLKLQDVTLDESLELKFNFRNFKHFETDLELPEGFVPNRVNVVLVPKGKKQSRIRKVFDWPNIESQEIK